MLKKMSIGFSFLVVCGCSGKYELRPVSGTVTVNGQPLEDATVTFTPIGGGADAPASSGRTDQSGKYKLALIVDETSGALVGQHKVVIAKNFESSSDIATPAERAKAELPEHDLTYEVVKSGTNQADFNLESKKGKKK